VGASGTINCTAASMANGATANFTLVVKVLALSGTVTDTLVSSSSASDPNSVNSSAQAITTINAPTTADLSIVKSTGTTAIAPGGSISYTITLTNNGPHNATNASMTDSLPASLLFQSISAPAGFSCATPAIGATGLITCTAASLANGASATFTLVVTVAGNATGTITNSAGTSGAQTDANSGNSSSSAGALAVISSADVSIAKTTGSTQAPAGSVISYTLTASNAGPSPATNVVVTDTLPAGLQFVSATPSQGSCSGTTTITCNLGTLAAAASATVTLNARVIATSGSVTNSATIAATESDPNSANNSGSAPPLTVVAAQAESIPTLSQWVLLMLIALVGLLGVKRT
jgi:uncharacterized repeat protein (TIGR01451 family)